MCLRRLALEAAAALVVQLELDDRAFERRRVRLRIGEVLAGDDRPRVEQVERSDTSCSASTVESLPKRMTLPGGSAAWTAGRAKKVFERVVRRCARRGTGRASGPARIIFEIDAAGRRRAVARCPFRRVVVPPVARGGLRRVGARGEQAAEPRVRAGAAPSATAATPVPSPFVLRDRVEARQRLLEGLRLVRDLELRGTPGSCTILMARSRSSMPGISTMMRSLPAFWTTVSETPMPSMRVRTTLSARSIASLLFGDRALRLVDLEREVHAARQVEPAWQGTRRTVS